MKLICYDAKSLTFLYLLLLDVYEAQTITLNKLLAARLAQLQSLLIGGRHTRITERATVLNEHKIS